MVTDRQMRVVWLQGVLGIPQYAAKIESMVLASIKVCVVTNLHWYVHGDLVLAEYAQGWWLILVKCDAENLIVVD